MAESNYRTNLSSFAWARPNQSTNDSLPPPSSASFFSSYIPIRSSSTTTEEQAYFALSHWERFLGFLLCNFGAGLCFLVAFFIGLPLLAIKPRKFAVAFSLGSILFMVGFAVLSGPIAHLKHICTAERIPFTVAYVGSLAATLFFAIGKRSYFGTLICAIIQCGALISYFVAYFPGGWQTLSFGSRMALRGAGSMLPV